MQKRNVWLPKMEILGYCKIFGEDTPRTFFIMITKLKFMFLYFIYLTFELIRNTYI